jgi:copper ion binding protein
LGVLAAALAPQAVARLRRRPAEAAEQTVHLAIEGMTCAHCVQAVTRALEACAGVASVRVDLQSGRATVAGSGMDPAAQIHAVEELGYAAKVAEEAGPARGASAAVQLSIQGMTCEHCVQSVTRALRACPGVASVHVDLEAGQAEVTGPALDSATLRRAVEEAGFTAAVASAPNTATSS